jgi:peroxiredoxin
MKWVIGSITTVAVLLTLGLTVHVQAQGSGAKMTRPAKMAQDFSATDHTGKKHSLVDYRGKVVVLEWLNPGCPFVQRHYREGTFKKLAEHFAGSGVIWLAVNSTSGNDAEVSKKWAAQHSLPYPVLVDKSGEVGKLFSAKTTPHIFVIGREGSIVYNGAVDDDPSGDKGRRTSYVSNAINAALVGSTPSVRETKPYGCAVKYAN